MNIRVGCLSLLLAAVACNAPTAPVHEYVPRDHGMVLTVSNNNQSAWATYTLPQTVTVTALDTFVVNAPTPVAGVVLDFVTRGNGVFNGTVSQDSVRLTTDANGKASVSWRLGKRVGGQDVIVKVVSSPIAQRSPSVTVVSADVVGNAPVQATATTPHFYNSNIPYEWVTTTQPWSSQVIDNLHINISADSAWALSNVKLAEVLDSATVVDSLTFTVESVQWQGESKGNLPIPECTLTDGVLTCPHGNVGYPPPPAQGGAWDLSKPYRVGEFWLKLRITTKAGAPVNLHHVGNDGIRPTSDGYWLRIGTMGFTYLQ